MATFNKTPMPDASDISSDNTPAFSSGTRPVTPQVEADRVLAKDTKDWSSTDVLKVMSAPVYFEDNPLAADKRDQVVKRTRSWFESVYDRDDAPQGAGLFAVESRKEIDRLLDKDRGLVESFPAQKSAIQGSPIQGSKGNDVLPGSAGRDVAPPGRAQPTASNVPSSPEVRAKQAEVFLTKSEASQNPVSRSAPKSATRYWRRRITSGPMRASLATSQAV